jgi:hypothetical protein
MFISRAGLSPDYRFDFSVDCMIDKEDFDLMSTCNDLPDFCDMIIPMPFTTCCYPLLLWSADVVRSKGAASATFEDGTASVTGVGSSGDDGVRIWPNMDEDWKKAVHVELENIELGGELSEGASIAFTGVKQGYDMEWLAWAEADHDAGVVGLTLGLGYLAAPTVELRASSGGTRTVAVTIGAPELVFSGNPINGTPHITAVSLAYTNMTTFAIEFDRAIEFTIVGEGSPATFMADRLVLSSENTLQPVQGLGPFEVTGTDLGWFDVSFEEVFVPCSGRVGDANGEGGDEPTIGDLAAIIDGIFISGSSDALTSIAEADINQSGGCDPTLEDITIGDLSILINYLFVAGPELGLPYCLDCP